MARKHLAACFVATLALAACGGSKKNAAADDVAGKKVAVRKDVTTTLAAATAQPDTVRAANAPLALTPAQRQLARADSMRRAQDMARQTAERVSTEQSHADSMHLAMADSIRSDSLDKVRETEVQRETFAYAGGTRDPFSSLINVTSAGPELADLQLVGVYMDLRNDPNSVAILREKVSSKRHKVRVGDRIGRLRVRHIRPRDVVFQIEDFGFERQETLSLRKQEDVTP